MPNQGTIRIIEILRFLYQYTGDAHPATASDIIAYLNQKGIQAVRQCRKCEKNSSVNKNRIQRRCVSIL